MQGIGNGVVLGWAADRADLGARVPVSLVVDGEIVAEGVADVPRPDLADLGIGDGAHGFLIALPERLQTPARRRILALAGPELTPLPAAASFWHKPAADGSWSDVVFEPGGALSAAVPDPPAARELRAIAAGGWLLDAAEELEAGAAGPGALARALGTVTAAAGACAELGIAYLPALVPRKREIVAPGGPDDTYGSPDGASGSGDRDDSYDTGRLAAALRAVLRDVDEIELLDLREVLRDARRHGAAYHRTDADWNDRGAFFVARALLKEAHKRVPALRPLSLSELHLRTVPGYRGALADAARVELVDGELRDAEVGPSVEAEEGVAIDASRLRALRMPVEEQLAQACSAHLRVYACPGRDEDAPLAVLGDRAALALVPWLAERTSRTTFFWTRTLPLAALELELPRVVVHLIRASDLAGA